MTTKQPSVPNHHAHFPGFAGPAGFAAAVTMLPGGKANASLAERLSELTAGDAVADIGCGPGTAARRAARLGASVVGIDPAPIMLRFARFLTRRSGTAVRYVQGSAEALPLPDSSVSVAWSIACVHHWFDLDAGLREVRRILKPDGRLVAIERLSRPGATGLASHGWTPDQAGAFADRCRAHGLAGRPDWAARRRPQSQGERHGHRPIRGCRYRAGGASYARLVLCQPVRRRSPVRPP